MSEWVLVPVEMVPQTVLYGDWEEPPVSVGRYIPPMPRATFDAMVERGFNAQQSASSACVEKILRAALPGLVVEGE